MGSLECAARFPHWRHQRCYQLPPGPPLLLVSASFCDKFSQSFNCLSLAYKCSNWPKSGIRLRPPCALSDEDKDVDGSRRQQRREEEEEEEQQVRSVARATASAAVPEEGTSATIISSCLVGLLTGVAVVVFNNAVRHPVRSLMFFAYLVYRFCSNYVKESDFVDGLMQVREIRDFFWDGIPYRGASWLREKPVEVIWKQVILVPASGGLIVSFLNLLQTAPALQVDQDSASSPPPPASSVSFAVSNKIKAALRPFLKAVAACVTLGTGNSLGPEGPSVEIGTSIAKGVGTSFDRNPNRKLSLAAAGAAAGISSGWSYLLWSIRVMSSCKRSVSVLFSTRISAF